MKKMAKISIDQRSYVANMAWRAISMAQRNISGVASAPGRHGNINGEKWRSR